MVFLLGVSTSAFASLAGEGGTPAGPIVNSGAPMNTVIEGTPSGPLYNNNNNWQTDVIHRHMPGNNTTIINGNVTNNDINNNITQTTIGPYMDDGQ